MFIRDSLPEKKLKKKNSQCELLRLHRGFEAFKLDVEISHMSNRAHSI